MNKHKGNNIKNVKKNCFQKTKQKNHGKVKLTHPIHLQFLGLVMNANKNTNKKKKNDENQIKNPNPNRENREKRAIEKSFLFFFFFFFVFVRLDRRENKYKERNKLVPH